MRTRKALFLDRDGVINVERGYVHRREDFHFQDGIFDLCRAAQSLGHVVVVVTNQAGIARGYYTERTFLDLTEWMLHEFSEQHIHIVRVYYCPYHPIHGVGRYKYDSPDRKPGPGMLLRAQADFDLDLTASALVGDTMSDIDAATAAGVGTKILLRQRAAHPTETRGEHLMREDLVHVLESLHEIQHRFFSSGPREVSARLREPGSQAAPTFDAASPR